jgi:hypothetical protein
MAGQPDSEHGLHRLMDDVCRLPVTVITLISNLSGPSGVLRDPYVPSQCRKGVPEYQKHRREWMEAVDLHLRAQHKEIARARWL